MTMELYGEQYNDMKGYRVVEGKVPIIITLVVKIAICQYVSYAVRRCIKFSVLI